MIWFIGAGCYHPDYITKAAIQILKKADCILYDALINEELLQYAPQAEKIYVGKIGHQPSTDQTDIFSLLLEKGRRYANVVRLKGGDPFVFGRGSEEMRSVLKHGLDCQYVPGISSAIAGLGFAGIPVTERKQARSFHVYTAHTQEGKDTLDYAQIVQTEGTHIFFMAHSHISQLVERLLQAGMSQDTPLAFCSQCTYPSQKTKVLTLKEVKETDLDAYPSPMMVVIGENVLFQPTLDNTARLPLFGQEILIASIDQELWPIEALTLEHGIYPHVRQVAKVVKNAKGWIDPSTYASIVFISKHAIDVFLEQLLDHEKDIRSLFGKKLICVGKKSAAYLKSKGVICDAICAHENAEDLPSLFEGKTLVISSKDHPEWKADVSLLYRLETMDFSAPKHVDACVATCPMAIEQLVDYKDKPLYCFSHKSQARARALGFQKIIPCASSKEALIQTLLQTLKGEQDANQL